MDAELAAALALLDEFPAPHGSLFPADEPEPEPQAPISSGQRRFRDPAVDRRRRQRRREERAELRRQAERGERRVAELRASNGKAGGGGWEQEVRRQQQARQAAERTNAGLRAALMAFLDAGARLRHQLPLLAAADELPGDEVVQLTSDFRAVVRTPLLFRSEPSHEAMAREARMLLQDTFMATDAVLDRHRRDDAAEISLASSVWPLQAADGDCVEHVTSTPLPCSFQKSFELLQRWMVRHFGYSINGITYSDIVSAKLCHFHYAAPQLTSTFFLLFLLSRCVGQAAVWEACRGSKQRGAGRPAAFYGLSVGFCLREARRCRPSDASVHDAHRSPEQQNAVPAARVDRHHTFASGPDAQEPRADLLPLDHVPRRAFPQRWVELRSEG